MKCLVSALVCAAFFFCSSGASNAAQTLVGGTVIVVSGSHTEQGGTATASSIPAPIFFGTHRFGRFELEAEGIPPLGEFKVGNSPTGLKTIALSYFAPSIRYHVTSRTWVGLGETIYNQQSMYQNTAYTELDRSRVVGLQYQVGVIVHQTLRSSLELQLAVNPHMSANLGQQVTDFFGNGTVFVYPWTSVPESGSQFDALVMNTVHYRRLELVYGLRVINLTMHFADGSLADQNRFTMPFIGFAAPIGK